ncbi:MAG: sugar phosphate isomerase/epimerase family protein [Phycisphaerales bacterium]
MLQPAFSTVACPERSMSEVFELAAQAGFLGVELRTFGAASRGPSSDPALTAPEKVRALVDRFGVRVCSLGTSCRFDEPVWPPVIGWAIADVERSIREAKWHIDLAIALESPLVRVFAFDPPPRESTRSATARIAQRLKLVVGHAFRTGVRVSIENGGRFATAARLMAIIDAVDSPLLGVSYNVAVAAAAGEAPEHGLNVLGDRLLSLRVKDFKGEEACALGDGDVPVREAVTRAARAGASVPVIVEWDRAWIPGLAPADKVLGKSAERLFGWMKESGGAPGAGSRGGGRVELHSA